MSSTANRIYSSIGISSLWGFKEETRHANSFDASFILNLSCSSSVAKSALQHASKILDILQMFRMIWGFIFFHTWEHHIIACLASDNFFESWWVVEESNREKTQSISFFLCQTSNEAIIPWSRDYTTLVTLSGKKEIVILNNCKVKQTKWSPLPTCLREWVA